MRIVHILTRMQRGGSEENTAEVCRWQASEGHEVWLVHGGDTHRSWDGALPGIRRLALSSLVHPVEPLQDLKALRVLRNVLRDLDADVVHTHQSKAGVIGRLAAVGQGACVVHGMHIMPASGSIMRAAERRVEGVTQRFIGVSKAVCAAHAKLGLSRAEDSVCVPSGIDLERFRDARLPRDWAHLIASLGSGATPRIALYLAALEPRKNHARFLKAWAQSCGDVPEAGLLIAGDGPLRGALEAQIRALGLGARVRLLGHRADPECLVAAADLVCLASEREGLPRVAMQALAGGRPFVATRQSNAGELVTHGHTGFLVETPEAVARASLRLLGDPIHLDWMKAQTRAVDLTPWSGADLGPATTMAYGLCDAAPVRRKARALGSMM